MRTLIAALMALMVLYPNGADAEPVGSFLQESEEYRRGAITVSVGTWLAVCPYLKLREQLTGRTDLEITRVATNVLRKMAAEDTSLYGASASSAILAVIFDTETGKACSASLKKAKGMVS